MSDIEIEFIGVSKRFPSRAQPDAPAVVRNLDLQIRRGVVLSTIGPSGCDKSRLLNMGSGLYLPIQGEVRVAGQRVTQPVKQESLMLQKDLLMPWRTIAANVELGLEIAGMAAPERRRIAGEWLARCHLQGFGGHWYCVSPMSLQMKSMDSFVRLGANRSHSRRYGEDLQRRLADEDAISCKRFGATQYWPYQLSGGMRQPAALARKLAPELARGGVDVAKQVGAGNALMGGAIGDTPIIVRPNGASMCRPCHSTWPTRPR